jgi:hypothetical protein
VSVCGPLLSWKPIMQHIAFVRHDWNESSRLRNVKFRTIVGIRQVRRSSMRTRRRKIV